MNADTLIEIVNNPFIGILYFLAIFYVAEVVVDITRNFNIVSLFAYESIQYKILSIGRIEEGEDEDTFYPLDRKPFNCTLCMCGWISIFLYVIDVKFGIDLFYLLPFALAGGALLVSKLKERMEIHIL